MSDIKNNDSDDSKNAEIILEKYMNKPCQDALNDFDSVFSCISKSGVGQLLYTNYSYIINTYDAIDASTLVKFQLLDVNYGNTAVKSNIISIKFRLYSEEGTIDDIRDFIKEARESYKTDIENKLGDDIYYFDHETHIQDTINSTDIKFSKRLYHVDQTFENVFFTEKKFLAKRVDHFLNGREWYKEKGIPYTFGTLFYGGPGTGKTSTIKAMAKESKRHVFNIRLSDVKTNTQLKNLFQDEYVSVLDPVTKNIEKYMIPIRKRLYVIEDIDCMTDLIKRRDLLNDDEKHSSRGGTNNMDRLMQMIEDQTPKPGVPFDPDDHKALQRLKEEAAALKEKNEDENSDAITLDALLNVLDGTYETPHRMICITTNDPDIIDPALVRPGRIDMIVNFTNSTIAMVKDMFNNFYDDETFENTDFSGFKEGQVSPAEVQNILFKFMHQKSALAISELVEESLKEDTKKYVRKKSKKRV